nr:integrase, catalytic region, zinc finger, CCHC-type, peptidase aspartic, catalytic [Tanacetum cinerariifolium]
MLNKENYVPWSSRLLRYAKSRPNGKLIHNSIINGPYVRQMIPEPGDINREVPVNKTFHVQTDDELTEKELKQIEANDQAIQTILLGLPEDIYAAIDSCETAQEIWLRVQQMMKGSDIGIQEKKAKLFNEWEMFTSNNRESIESYYHRFLKLMNDLKRNKHFLEKIASNLKFLNNLQPEWSRHVTIVHQTKDLHTTDYTQLYDFLKYNQKEVDELKTKPLEKTQDPLALMENSNNPYAFSETHQDQPSFNQNYIQQPMPNPEDITDPTTAMNMALALMAKVFKLNYSTPTNNNQRISSNLRNRQIAQPDMNMGQDRQMQMVGSRAKGNATGHNGYQIRCYNCRGVGHFARNCTVRPRRRDAAYLQTQLLIAQKEEAVIQLQAKVFDLMAATADLDEIEKVNANCILMANLQHASTSGTQTDKAPVYDSDGSAEVYNHEDCYDNDIFNMFTQEEQYTELLKPILESHQVPRNDNNVISEVNSVEQSEETVEQHPANVEETYLNKQLSKEKSTVSFLLEEKKKLKSDFKTHEGELLDKQIQLQKKINELYNILVKTGQSIQMIHMLSPKPDSFYHIEQKMALGYQNHFYLKQAQKKHQSLYDGKVLLEKHDPHFVHDSKETLQLAQECRQKMKQLNKEMKPTNYTKINHLSGEAAKFVGDFKSLTKEADESLAKHKALELEIERLLREVVSQDIISVVQNNSIVDTSNLQTNLERQFCDSDLEVAFRRNACFVRNLEGVDLLKRVRSINLYTINLHDMASASPIYLMARASSTKSWLYHQRLSHFNFDTINDLAKNDLVSGLLKFKYNKEHLCPSCKQGKSKRASHPPKPVPNSRQRLHLLHMDLCGPMRIASINGKRIYNRRTKKIMKTMNVSCDELSAMAFEQRSSKPGLQSMTSGQISSGLDLTYAPSTITTQQPTEGELDLLFKAMYDDYIGGQPSATARTVPAAQVPQDVDELNSQQQHVQQQGNQAQLQSETIADNVPNAMFDGNSFVNPFANPSTSERKPKKDKIGSKSNKNGKRGEAGKSQKQLQWIEEEKLKKMQKDWPEMHNPTKSYERKKKRRVKSAIY